MKYQLRTREMAHLLANRLAIAAVSRRIHNVTKIDGCYVCGSPAIGVHISNELGEERITWDSFRELWLRNIECDEAFVTKPELLRKNGV